MFGKLKKRVSGNISNINNLRDRITHLEKNKIGAVPEFDTGIIIAKESAVKMKILIEIEKKEWMPFSRMSNGTGKYHWVEGEAFFSKIRVPKCDYLKQDRNGVVTYHNNVDDQEVDIKGKKK